MKKKILVCVGTRPNLIKITQLDKAFNDCKRLEYILLHTGQHYDKQMNTVFFEELGIKKPDIQFSLSKQGHIGVITEIMQKFEAACTEIEPDLVVVPGDVNSSFACAFVANRLDIPVAHIESGLRSFDQTMPEEVNRILIDNLSSLHFVTEKSGIENLNKEGFTEKTIKFVGNTMIDTMVKFNPLIDASKVLDDNKLEKNKYAIFTFHRPLNVDSSSSLEKLVELIKSVSLKIKVVFPIHPRTANSLKKYGLFEELGQLSNINILEPQGYIDFLSLIKHAKLVITDSGGIQEETTFLRVPCLTVRPNTERPITCEIGTNKLLEFKNNIILKEVIKIIEGNAKAGQIPDLWDGKASGRIAKEIEFFFNE